MYHAHISMNFSDGIFWDTTFRQTSIHTLNFSDGFSWDTTYRQPRNNNTRVDPGLIEWLPHLYTHNRCYSNFYTLKTHTHTQVVRMIDAIATFIQYYFELVTPYVLEC